MDVISRARRHSHQLCLSARCHAQGLVPPQSAAAHLYSDGALVNSCWSSTVGKACLYTGGHKISDTTISSQRWSSFRKFRLTKVDDCRFWAGAAIKAGSQMPLEELLEVMAAEANPLLRPGFIRLDDVAKWAGLYMMRMALGTVSLLYEFLIFRELRYRRVQWYILRASRS